MPQLDTSTYSAQLFWLIVLFSILFLAIQFYFEPKIRGIFKRRELKLRKKLILAKQMKKGIENLERTIIEKEQYAHDHMRSLTHNAEIESQKAILKKKQELNLLQTNTLKKLEQELEKTKDSFFSSPTEEKALTHLLTEKILGFTLCDSVYEEAIQKAPHSYVS